MTRAAADGIRILDTTLREGEQTPGVVFTLEQKTVIAQMLDEFGVSIIESGHPAVSPEIASHAKAIAALGLHADVLAHSRAMKGDIDLAIASDADWVGIFFSVADRRLEEQFRKDEAQATRLIEDCVSYAKSHGLKVRYTPEDTVRTGIDRVLRVARAAVEAGADRISVADTTGYMTPSRMHAFVSRLVDAIGPRVNVHCHNDLGLATANALAGVEAGATIVDATVNGLGERAGIVPLHQIATAIRLTEWPEAPWRLDMLPRISATVQEATGFPVAFTEPVVGRNAFSHNAGLHVAAVLQNPAFYESVPCLLVGRERRIVLDKFSGREAARFRLREIGVSPTEDEVQRVLDVVKGEGRNDVPNGELALLYLSVRGGAAAPAAARAALGAR